jgi:UDP-N-acetylglucosamine acyltransferase
VGERVTIGPYSVIGAGVTLGADTRIGPHVVVEGDTKIGERVTVSQFASVGADPQDLKYAGEKTNLEIGNDTILREFVTVHRGTVDGGGVTRVGDQSLLMAYCHVAHDCQVGSRVIMANGATLGGHVEVGDHVVIGGLSAVHQFCRIGAYAFLGGMSGVNKDIPPFVKYWGSRGGLYGLNLVGLKRHGFPKESLSALRDAYRTVFQGVSTVQKALDEIEARYPSIPEITEFVGFIRASERGVPMPEGGDEAP